MNVFFSAGEASGDAYAAALADRMRVLRTDLDFAGIGSSRLRAAGVTLVADSANWGSISITQALRVYLRVRRGYRIGRAFLKQHPPGLFVPIDFGGMNVKLARDAKALGWKVMYFVPPGSWRRDRQGKDMAQVSDAVVTPFPWSAETLRAQGANAHWFGHPLKELLSLRTSGARSGIAVLPGSRGHEIAEHVPLVARAVRGLSETVKFALAPHLDAASFAKEWRHRTGRDADEFVVGETARVLQESRAAIVCSGTATLEAALCRCPSVIIYRVSKVMEMEARLIGFKVPRFIGLPNLILDREIVPELIQDAASPARIREVLDGLLVDGPARGSQLRAFQELDDALGEPNAITKAAALGLRLLG